MALVPLICSMAVRTLRITLHYNIFFLSLAKPARFIDFCMSRIQLLQSFNVKPILVFDGANLPMKSHQEKIRSLCTTRYESISNACYSARQQSRDKVYNLLASGNIQAANSQIQKAMDVTPQMAASLMRELQRCKVEYVVAPYEADAQMAWLDRTGKVAAVITEDSDLLLFGCKRVLFKLDRDGFADEIRLERLPDLKELDLSSFTFEKFRQMCMLSGCDYIPSINGMGLKTAHRYLSKYQTITRVLQVLRAEMPTKMPENYEADFVKAELTFMHQRTWDTERRRICFLNPLPAHMDAMDIDGTSAEGWDFLGPPLRDETIARGICEGYLCPNTLVPFADQTYSRVKRTEARNIQPKLPFEIVLDKKMIVADRITIKRCYHDVCSGKEEDSNNNSNDDDDGIMLRSKGFAFSSSIRSTLSSLPRYLSQPSPKRNKLLPTDSPQQKSIKEFFKPLVTNK